MEIIEIHEFSTGINFETLPGGGWRSLGFKVGEYMNSTLPNIIPHALPNIPHAVEGAIRNKLFDVSKDRNNKWPTFVGRVVQGNRDSHWSVVAAVTPGSDEYGRSTSFYRYFLCEGADSLWKILAWMDDYREEYKKYPVFNPLETKSVGQPNSYNISFDNFQPSTPVVGETTPHIIEPGQCDLNQINQMAKEKARATGQPVSWAYNVEALERPEAFLIIQPDSDQSYKRLMAMGQEQASNIIGMLPPSEDGAAIETAIKGLISGSPIEPQWIQTLLTSLQENQLTLEQWNTIFDDPGATKAIETNSSHPNMVRLLTLRAIVLPETLSEFLSWLKIEKKTKKKNAEKQETSLQFQSQLGNYSSQLQPLLVDRSKIALEQILVKNIPVPAFAWLLDTKGSLWKPYKNKLLQNVRNDLEIIQTSSNSLIYGESVWKELQKCLQSRSYSSASYKPFAVLFAQLGDYELAAYFYQVSDGVVPKDIFKQALPSVEGHEGTILGLPVKRNITFSEHSRNIIQKHAANLAIFFLVFPLGIILGWGLKGKNKISNEVILAREFSKIIELLEQNVNDLTEDFLSENSELTEDKVRQEIIEKYTDIFRESASDIFCKTAESLKIEPSRCKKQEPDNQNKPEEELEKPIEMPAEEKTNAVKEFSERTKPSFEKMIGELQQDLGVQENAIFNEIKNTLGVPELIYAKVRKADPEQIDILVTAIYNYQSKFGTPDGIIDLNGTTYNKLKDEVKQLQLKKLQEAKKAFSPRTYKSLNQMISELKQELEVDENAIFNEIKNTLGVPELIYAKVRKADPEQIDILVTAIYNYQSKFGTPDGIIDLNGTTYNKLKDEVKQLQLKKLQEAKKAFSPRTYKSLNQMISDPKLKEEVKNQLQ